MQQSKWDKGISLINKGCDYQESGDKTQAAGYYERGIQYLLDHIKTMPSSNRKFQKQQKINKYLDILTKLRPDNNNQQSQSQNQRYQRQKSYPSYQQKQNKLKHPRTHNNNIKNKQRSKHDQELFDRIQSEIISTNPNVTFSDVVGLENVKQALLEAVILPAVKPEIFVGPRSPPKGLLLFGPPGNGKTFIAKALASECNATFFCISSSSLTSRYVGEGEKLVRALFECARGNAPSIIFIDEIDSLLTSRGGDNEQEASRRMKTEFLVQFDGVQSGNNKERVLLVGATNLPWELDDAALRRFSKRILVNKPDDVQREYLIKQILYGREDENECKQQSQSSLNVKMSEKQIKEIVLLTDGYSASDLKNLVNDAAMGPVRDIGMDILNKQHKDVPPVTIEHFRDALENIKPSTSKQAQSQFIKWNKEFGTILKVKKKHKKNMDMQYKKATKQKESSGSGWFSMFQ